MDLAERLLEQASNPSLTHQERARLRCLAAKEFEESGDYEGARQAMGSLWRRAGERPKLEGLDDATRAEVLLRAGTLTGWIGSARQLEGAQDAAKDLISEAMTIFEGLGCAAKVDEAQADLAYCYWRQGAFDEARVLLREVVERASGDVKLVALIRQAIVERWTQDYAAALRIYTEAAPLLEGASHALKGKFHVNHAVTLRNLGTIERREDYIDRALIEYTAASFHFEKAGHKVYCACVENNIAVLFLNVGKYAEAHEHLDRARRVLTGLKDSAHTAQVDETRARVLLAEGRNEEAERFAAAAVRALKKGGEQSILAEALTSYGTALARLGDRTRAHIALQRAVTVAEEAGASAVAGRAALTIIEELSDHAPRGELCALFEEAADHLAESERPNVPARLVEAARTLIRVLRKPLPASEEPPFDWQGFSFREAIRRYERILIQRALQDSDGVVSRAAQLLGFKHYQSLIALINKRHPDLRDARSPVVSRRKGIIKK